METATFGADARFGHSAAELEGLDNIQVHEACTTMCAGPSPGRDLASQ